MRSTRVSFLVSLLALSLWGLAGCGAAQLRSRRDPNLVTLQGALANLYVPAEARTNVTARVRIGTAPVDPSRRPPINLSLVIDTSGSMEGRAIRDARLAAQALVDALSPSDRVSIVVFNSRAEVIVPSGELDGDQRTLARRMIAEIQAQGTTDMAGGLRLGMGELFNHYDSAGINRLVLLGDGVPNDPSGIEEMARALGSRGVTVTALGLGQDYDETLMGLIAQRSGGRFHYVEDSARVADVFRQEVLRIQRVVAHNAVAVLIPGPGVQLESVVGQQSERSGTTLRVPVGDVTEGENRDLIVRASVQARRHGTPVEVMDVTLEFTDAVNSSGRCERRVFLGAHATNDQGMLQRGRNEEVERDAARVQLAAGTVEAIREARAGNVAQAQEQLDRLISEARNAARANQFADLDAQANEVSTLREALPSLQAETVATLPSSTPAEPPATTTTAQGDATAVGGLRGSGGGSAASQPSPPRQPVRASPASQPAQVVRQVHSQAMHTLSGN